MIYQNPVIPGYHPDPSVCRVGDDYYLVTSSFEFFPGVPLFHSKNLAQWTQLGHVLTRRSQLELEGCRCSGGIYAPTIRYHDGVFFMITTNVSNGGNFIVHTRDIRGEWSEPAWVDHGGIDPSLFFDQDGTAWFCGTCDQQITLFAVNPFTGERLTEKQVISRGSGGVYPEAPHIYRRGDYYYLLLAEGGTEYGHRATISRAKSITGPYEPCPTGPILWHQNRQGHPIQATGHADLFEDAKGQWWAVFLGIRPNPGVLLHHFGRETFLAPVTWSEDGWPIVGENGGAELIMDAPLPAPMKPEKPLEFTETFGKELSPAWNFVRNPDFGRYQWGDGKLVLKNGVSLRNTEPVFLGVRQPGTEILAETRVCLPGKKDAEGGIAAYYSKDYYYALSLKREGGQSSLILSFCVHGLAGEIARIPLDSASELSLRITADPKEYRFWYREGEEWRLAGTAPTAGLATEGTMYMTFTGVYLGLFSQLGTAAFPSFSMK